MKIRKTQTSFTSLKVHKNVIHTRAYKKAENYLKEQSKEYDIKLWGEKKGWFSKKFKFEIKTLPIKEFPNTTFKTSSEAKRFSAKSLIRAFSNSIHVIEHQQTDKVYEIIKEHLAKNTGSIKQLDELVTKFQNFI